jgi:hypothetical protein
MKHNRKAFRFKLLVAFGFLLNMLWEFAQCLVLYDMSGWSFWRAAVYMWAAIAGDVLIVLGVVMASWILSQRSMAVLLSRRGWITTLALGLVAGLLLEWFARVLNLWSYSALMPTISVGGQAVGLAPMTQVTILPAATLYLAILYQKLPDAGSS